MSKLIAIQKATVNQLRVVCKSEGLDESRNRQLRAFTLGDRTDAATAQLARDHLLMRFTHIDATDRDWLELVSIAASEAGDSKLSKNFFLGALFYQVNGLCYEGAGHIAIANLCDDYAEGLSKKDRAEFDAAYEEMEDSHAIPAADEAKVEFADPSKLTPEFFLGALHFALLCDNSQEVLENAIYTHKRGDKSLCLTEEFIIGSLEMSSVLNSKDTLSDATAVTDVIKDIEESAKLSIYSASKAAKMVAYCKANGTEIEEYRESMKVADISDLVAALV